MNDEEFRRKELIRQVVDNPMFNEIITNIKNEMAQSMLILKKEEDRDNLFHEAQALERFAGHLRKIANEVKVARNGN